MKIRTDFVTNSSSSSYVVEVRVVSVQGNEASLNLIVGFEESIPACAVTNNLSLDAISEKKDIKELCDLLYSSIILNNYSPQFGDDSIQNVSVDEVDTLKSKRDAFNKECESVAQSMEDVEKVVVTINKSGYGDSAIYTRLKDNPELIEFKNKYEESSDKNKALEEFVNYLKSHPEMTWFDNEEADGGYDEFIYRGTDKELAKLAKEFLQGNGRDYWMLSVGDITEIDIKNNTECYRTEITLM